MHRTPALTFRRYAAVASSTRGAARSIYTSSSAPSSQQKAAPSGSTTTATASTAAGSVSSPHVDIIVSSAKPFVQQIFAAPHRDVSHVSFGDLLNLYVAGRQHAAAAAREGSSGVSLLNEFDAIINEWCLRSVFSSSWREVDVDVAGMLMHLEHHRDVKMRQEESLRSKEGGATADTKRTSSTPSANKDDDSAHTTSLTLLSQWPNSGVDDGNHRHSVVESSSSVLTASCFIGSLQSYHHLPLPAASTSSSSSGGAGKSTAAVELVRANGTKRLEGVMASMRRRETYQHHTNNAGGGAAAAAPADLNNVGGGGKDFKTLWVPFSTLWDIRRCAFGKGTAQRRSPHHRPVSPQDTLSLVGSLQLVRQALQLQHQLLTDPSRHHEIQLRVVPPTVEFDSVLRILRGRRPQQQSQKKFGAEELCESSLVRWIGMSRLFPSCALVVEGALERKIALEFGDVAAQVITNGHKECGVLMEHHRGHQHHESAGATTSSSKQHQNVVTQCGDLSQKLARREQFVRAAPRY
ncbi:membrane-associated protein, putative [Bodo saltans]|uniref:Membrane-associated protein, putative n=1 Tax=Bodo saltans TaxID=75058 RepID=A0A0S4JJD9_BODSA|nr:membrane-associated protein, putative [Bodo saltans]|eukprot:CUG90033.1 membrane-associated protein, putative [Bodo saltans]